MEGRRRRGDKKQVKRIKEERVEREKGKAEAENDQKGEKRNIKRKGERKEDKIGCRKTEGGEREKRHPQTVRNSIEFLFFEFSSLTSFLVNSKKVTLNFHGNDHPELQ